VPPVVARVGDASISATTLELETRDSLFAARSEEYNLRRRVLDRLVEATLLEKEAATRGLSVDALLRMEVAANVPPITDAERMRIYEANKGQYEGVPQATALALIDKDLRQRRLDASRSTFLGHLRTKWGVSILIEPPRARFSITNAPALGPADAPVTIVEFSDFQCPYCAQLDPILRDVLARYGTKVRLVYRQFPLRMHRDAAKAAEASLCASDQGKFWELHDRLFGDQADLELDRLKAAAAGLGLQAEAFSGCLESGKYKSAVAYDIEEGTRNGVSGTPTCFVNGRLLTGAQSFAAISQVVEEELSANGQAMRGAAQGPKR
jgi:predicted DsbA family dithiol-disulfide isomerase